MKETKKLEFYFDANTFSKDILEKTLKEVKRDFPQKQINSKLYKNKFGTYILKVEFCDKDNYFTKMKEKRRQKKDLSIYEKNEKVKKISEKSEIKDLKKIAKKKRKIQRQLKIEEQRSLMKQNKIQEKLQKEEMYRIKLDNKKAKKQQIHKIKTDNKKAKKQPINKISLDNRKVKKQKNKIHNVEQIYGTRIYGQYKNTGTYRPI